VRYRARLAGAGTGQHADRAARRQHGFALLVVQARNQGISHYRHVVHLGSGCRQTGRVVIPGGPGLEWFIAGLRYRVMTNAALTMYTTSWCGYCFRLKTALKAQGIAYDEVDIEQDSAAADFVSSVNGGNRTVPTVKFADGSTMTNPSASEVKAKLAG
jgi:mycoredoxin